MLIILQKKNNFEEFYQTAKSKSQKVKKPWKMVLKPNATAPTWKLKEKYSAVIPIGMLPQISRQGINKLPAMPGDSLIHPTNCQKCVSRQTPQGSNKWQD